MKPLIPRKTQCTKEEIVRAISIQIDESMRNARRVHKQYLRAIRRNDHADQEYFYDLREGAIILARQMKNLLLPPHKRLKVYPFKLQIVRRRRWKREEAATCSE